MARKANRAQTNWLCPDCLCVLMHRKWTGPNWHKRNLASLNLIRRRSGCCWTICIPAVVHSLASQYLVSWISTRILFIDLSDFKAVQNITFQIITEFPIRSRSYLCGRALRPPRIASSLLSPCQTVSSHRCGLHHANLPRKLLLALYIRL